MVWGTSIAKTAGKMDVGREIIMKTILRAGIILIAVGLVLGLPVLAQAQGGRNIFCSGLSAEDCEFLEAAQKATSESESFALPVITFRYELSDSTERVSITATGAGEMVRPNGGPLAFHWVIDDMQIEPGNDQVQPITELLLTNTGFYLQRAGQWFGRDWPEAERAQVELIFNMLTPNAVALLSNLIFNFNTDGILTMTRGEDVAWEGMTLANFHAEFYTSDLLVKLLSSPMVIEFLKGQGVDAGLDDLTPDDQAAIKMIFQLLLSDTTISLDQWFGTDDLMLHRLILDVQLNLNLGMFDPSYAEPLVGTLYLEVEMNRINETFAIEPPDQFGSLSELGISANDAVALGLGHIDPLGLIATRQEASEDAN
jgi:hypothetical protein